MSIYPACDQRSILRKSHLFWAIALFSTVVFPLLTGCQSNLPRPNVGSYSYESPTEDISIQEMAQGLGLRVVETNDTYVKLGNAQNTVLVFSFANAQFYVNGEAVGRVGRTRSQDGTLYVEASLQGRIQPRLKRGSSMPSLARKPRPVPRRGLVVVDPGHGGKDPGATSVLGFPEKDINLQVGRQLASALRQRGFKVILTRDTDRFIELEERAALANRHGADLFISIHADYCDTPSVTGFTIYKARDASHRTHTAAHSVKQAMLGAGQQSRGIREADFRVLVKTRCPAILVELGYLSNYWESRRLCQTDTQQRLAQAIASGTNSLWAGSASGNVSAVGLGDRRARSRVYSAP